MLQAAGVRGDDPWQASKLFGAYLDTSKHMCLNGALSLSLSFSLSLSVSMNLYVHPVQKQQALVRATDQIRTALNRRSLRSNGQRKNEIRTRDIYISVQRWGHKAMHGCLKC